MQGWRDLHLDLRRLQPGLLTVSGPGHPKRVAGPRVPLSYARTGGPATIVMRLQPDSYKPRLCGCGWAVVQPNWTLLTSTGHFRPPTFRPTPAPPEQSSSRPPALSPTQQEWRRSLTRASSLSLGTPQPSSQYDDRDLAGRPARRGKLRPSVWNAARGVRRGNGWQETR